MKRVALLIMMLIAISAVFGGTVSGEILCPECTEADSFTILIVYSFESLDSAITSTCGYPYEFAIDGEFSDTRDYFIFAAYLGALPIPISGDPAGVYGDNPFHTTDGNFSGIEMPVDDTLDVDGQVIWDGGYENVYINTSDFFMTFLSGDTTWEVSNVPVNDDGTFTIEDCPSGPKGVMAYVDENTNGEYDEGETCAWYTNALQGVLIVAGGMDEFVLIDNLGIKENIETPENMTLNAAPNPFNSTVLLSYNISNEEDVDISVFDSNGKLVRNLFNGRKFAGEHTLSWDGTDNNSMNLPSGVYTVSMTSSERTISHKITLIK